MSFTGAALFVFVVLICLTSLSLQIKSLEKRVDELERRVDENGIYS